MTTASSPSRANWASPSRATPAVGKIEYFGTIGNVQKDGTVLGSSHKKTIFLTGNNMWHSDASFKPVPAFLSIMCAYETPAEGGTTMFVSLRAAYDRLSPERKAELDPLIAIHDYVYSRSKVAPDAVSPELAASLPPVRQRLVRTNPATGARNLFLGSHVREIEGMSHGRRPRPDRRTDRSSDPARTRLRPRLATGRRRLLGQPLPPPRRKRLRRRPPPPLHAPDPRQRNVLDVGGGRLGGGVACTAGMGTSDTTNSVIARSTPQKKALYGTQKVAKTKRRFRTIVLDISAL